MRAEARSHRSGARAFSLIEILIAVLILALGLLGLGAVFPVVIREQRVAYERISGTIGENNVRSFLNGNSALVPAVTYQVSGSQVQARYSGLSCLQEPWSYYGELNDAAADGRAPDFENPGSAEYRFRFSPDGLWVTNRDTEFASTGESLYRDTGDVLFVDAGSSGLLTQGGKPEDLPPSLLASVTNPSVQRIFPASSIPLSSRLNPGGDADSDRPGTVWDLAARRMFDPDADPGATLGDPRRLQVVVFTRRVDPQIRLDTQLFQTNRGYPLRRSFLDHGLQQRQRRLPVGEATATGNGSGLPTYDGTDGNRDVRYSSIREVGSAASGIVVVFDGDPQQNPRRDLIEVRGIGGGQARQENWALLRQLGQRVVDNMGNIYTVVGSEQNGANTGLLKIDPPVGSGVSDSDASSGGQPAPYRIRQLLFTPQIPVSVFVTEIEP